MTIRILLVDDHRMVREGVRSLLGASPDVEVVGEAGNGWEALDLVRTLSPDVVVMDIRMPDLNGVEATRLIRAQYKRVKVIALSMHADSRYVHNMLYAGACGYVLKSSAHEELLHAVRAASQGKAYLSPEIVGMVVERSTTLHSGPGVSAYSTLSARERQVLQLVAEGKSSAGIAKELRVTVRTIETHRLHLVQKLGLHGTADLTKYAIREGLTSVEE
jgi:DNA-binding NarL/FixJ family response regulator